ncbi:MAG TPA: Ig-like domain-containing protein [Candidatus Saccharimonadales bacterium]|nr:Ig-like domain-containing protein [Candidatus Saccharimonadales bacterium]
MPASRTKTSHKKSRSTAKKQSNAGKGYITIKGFAPFKKRRVGIFAALFAVFGLAWLILAHAIASFSLVGTHPQAALQPTATGQTIQTLKAWNGKLYAGYGDWAQNTGPIDINPLDLTSKTFATQPLLSANTDAIILFRSLNGKLYAPSTDPRKDKTTGQEADFALGDTSTGVETWTNHVNQAGMTHVFDMTSFGGNLWMAGSKGYNAVVYRSSDGGATWTQSLSEPSQTSCGIVAARYYFMVVYNNKLWVQAGDLGCSVHPNSMVFDGTSWSSGPAITTSRSAYNANTFAGKVVIQDWQSVSASALRTFNGTTNSTVLSSVFNYTIASDGYLYALQSNGNVSKSLDLTNWTVVATAPTTARSIEVMNGIIYVGTTDSKIYAADTASQSDTTAPSVSISQPLAGASVSGTTTLAAIASDNVGVTKVEFYVNGTLVGSDTSSPYNASWNTAGYANGSYSISAIAYDAAGNTRVSVAVGVTVNNLVVTDTTPPVVTITKPTDGTVVHRKVSITVTATDNVQVARIEVYGDSTLLGTVYNASATINWDTHALASGPHSVTARAYDAAGNSTSTSINVIK